MSAYEGYQLGSDISEAYKKFGGSVEDARKQAAKLFEQLKLEIDTKIDTMHEVTILLGLAAKDPQGPMTRKAEGRLTKGSDQNTIQAAIQQKIPFRKVISMVCEAAEYAPRIDLRKKPGVTVKDIPASKLKLLEQLAGMSAEQLADVDLDDFIVVRLKMLATAIIFEFMDQCLDWRSPLKTEVAFGPAPAFADPPVEGTSKLKRSGGPNPFYPGPYQYKRGSITSDLMITEYRAEPPEKNNIFALVEIKFPGDRIEGEQMIRYERLLRAAAGVKTDRSPVRFDNLPVSSGGRFSLFRYPEDVAAPEGDGDDPDKKHQRHPKSKKGGDKK